MMQYCFVCCDLPEEIFNQAIEYLKSRYTRPSVYEKEDYTEWEYCGVNHHGDIMLYNKPEDYIDPDVEPFYNIVNVSKLIKEGIV